MVKVLSRQPAWLDHGTPAFDFFQPADTDKSTIGAPANGAQRKIAHRGAEVFVAVGNELRWSDLALLQAAGEDAGEPSAQTQRAFKILKTPAARPIQQITVSPSRDFIAILTSHTCHVCLLPSHEHLKFQDPAPIKLRSFTVGPTAHVLEQSPLVSAIWHPLSPTGNGLVTITKDACVRLWQLDPSNRSTFNEPALAVDLKKLANASTNREDFSASKYGTNKGFSPDDVEMEVAAGCFGGRGEDNEDGWSAMTLWIAMTEGDVYALCPFLPSQFWIPTTCLPSLSTSVVAKQRVVSRPGVGTELEKLTATQQSAWLADLDDQDPTPLAGVSDIDVYSRPTRLSAVPRLQGPFQLSPEPDFGEITDIHVVAPKINLDDLFDEEEDIADLEGEDGLSIGIICLATNTGQVHVCLNIEGVEAEWLPSRATSRPLWNDIESIKSLLVFQTVDLATNNQGSAGSWPTFTASPLPEDRYRLFSTQPNAVFALSFLPWISSLEQELSSSQPSSEGVDFRVNVLLDSPPTAVDTVTTHFDKFDGNCNAAIAIFEEMRSDVGYVVLTTASNLPYTTIMDLPYAGAHPFEPDMSFEVGRLTAPESRAPYQPDQVFFQPSALPNQVETWRRESAAGGQGDLKGLVTFSPYTLSKITEAHRILSFETHNFGIAAADLFRRCERMMSEMQAQVEKVRELSNRINSVTGEDEFPEQNANGPQLVRGGKHKIQNRIQQSKDKTLEIQERVEGLRKKMRGLGGKELSAKERVFAEEVDRIEQSIQPPSDDAPTSPVGILKMENSSLTVSTETRSSADGDDQDTIATRFQAVNEMYQQLIKQASAAQKELENRSNEATTAQQASSRPSTAGGARAADYRQKKLQQVFALLERETALVDAVSERLERLQLAAR